MGTLTTPSGTYPGGGVSIQLMSPASGDYSSLRKITKILQVSIQLMSPASGDIEDYEYENEIEVGFHSINVPSEWGLLNTLMFPLFLYLVSIQLMSPASGDLTTPQFITFFS